MSALAKPDIIAGSPISKLPYDVLREIFIHCLPRYPFNDSRQPNIQSAPMLLCHVCSTWRVVARTSAILWSHLFYRLTIYETEPDLETQWGLLKNQVEFIRWWQENQGTVAPFLTFVADILDLDDQPEVDQEQLLAGDSTDFLLVYLMSAQYLDLDGFLWDRIRDRIDRGDQVSFPNLHTAVEDMQWDDIDVTFFRIKQHGDEALPYRPCSQVKRLHITQSILPRDAIHPYGSSISTSWATLTHISLLEVTMPVKFWFSLTLAAPNLQWGYFNIDELTETRVGRGVQYTLSQLTTLFFILSQATSVEFPLSLLFADLHLPALHTITLNSFAKSWHDQRSIIELSTILKSTPNVTTLTLRDCFLSFGDAAEPVWKHAPSLTHLRLEHPGYFGITSSDVAKEKLEDYVKDVFTSYNGWLNLSHPACQIHTITFATTHLENISDFAQSCIRNLAEKTPHVTFQLASGSLFDEAEAMWVDWGAIW